MTEEEKKAMDALTKERDDAKAALEAEKARKAKKTDDDDEEDEEEEEDDSKKKKKSKSKSDDGEDEDDDLDVKVKRRAKAAEESKAETKRLENALKFNLGISEFVKGHVDLLPQNISDIVKAADKEEYDSAPEKAGAVRTAIIKEFFSVQANVDLLTPTLKSNLEDFLKLTKSGKEEKSESVFQNVFEPTLEMLKRLKKAEEVGKSRNGFSGNKVEDGYKARLIATSKKTYLGEKGA